MIDEFLKVVNEKLVDKLYAEKGSTPEQAKERLFKKARDEGVSDLSAVVQYEVSVAGKRGKVVSGKAHEDYAVAFASALSAAKVDPNKYDPAKNTLEVTAQATYQVAAETHRKPSGSAPSGYSGRSLTDMF